jgi:cbb3-type cytochrome oxidase subunit 3
MWKETVRALETGALAEIAVVAFMVAFVSIVVYAFTLSKRQRTDAKNMPLDDAPPAPESSPDDDARSRGDGAATHTPILTL